MAGLKWLERSHLDQQAIGLHSTKHKTVLISEVSGDQMVQIEDTYLEEGEVGTDAHVANHQHRDDLVPSGDSRGYHTHNTPPYPPNLLLPPAPPTPTPYLLFPLPHLPCTFLPHPLAPPPPCHTHLPLPCQPHPIYSSHCHTYHAPSYHTH